MFFFTASCGALGLTRTPDEDFSILLEAAVMYDRRVAAALNETDATEEDKLWIDMHDGKQFMYPRVLFIITGKGPEREKYEGQIKKLKLRRVAFRTMWLSAVDYPLLLGSSDLGVCLHTSSSGLDLPMKVVDMCLDVDCQFVLFHSLGNYIYLTCIQCTEFSDFSIMLLLKGFPDRCDALRSLRDGALRMGSSSRWSSTWEKHALPLLNKLITSDGQ